MWLDEALTMVVGSDDDIKWWLREEVKKHKRKEHFIPIKYRVLSGFIQSLNIKFGNFLELLIAHALYDIGFEFIEEVSRKKIPLALEERCEQLIDAHINFPLKADNIERELPGKLEGLFREIFELQNTESGKFNRRTLDINLFMKKGGVYYYFEVKYNDDHDTGKYGDINRKFLKTFAGLANKYRFQRVEEFKPILYYFNPYRRYYPSPYLRDGIEVFRGRELFEKFEAPQIYEQLTDEMRQFGTKAEERFNQLRELIFSEVDLLLAQDDQRLLR